VAVGRKWKESFLFSILLSFLLISCGKTVPEKIVDEKFSPDKSFKLIITKNWQGVPYGVKGNIYSSNGGNKKKVDDYFEDFEDDIDQKIEWDDSKNAFVLDHRIDSFVIVDKDGFNVISTK
jgi:hypothetical protein